MISIDDVLNGLANLKTPKQDRYAGNCGDGPKHSVLARLLKVLRPQRVIETHGGCGLYRVDGSAFTQQIPSETFLAAAQAELLGRMAVDAASTKRLYAGSGALALAATGTRLDVFENDAAAIARLVVTAAVLGAQDRLRIHPCRFQSPGIGLQELWGRVEADRALLVADPFHPEDLPALWQATGQPSHLLAWWPTTSRWQKPRAGLESLEYNRFYNALDDWKKIISGLKPPYLVWRWTWKAKRKRGEYALLVLSRCAPEIQDVALAEHRLYSTVAGYGGEGPVLFR